MGFPGLLRQIIRKWKQVEVGAMGKLSQTIHLQIHIQIRACFAQSRYDPAQNHTRPQATKAEQCSQRGSPSVLVQDEHGRHCVIPYRPLQSPTVPCLLRLFSNVFQCCPPSLPSPYRIRQSYVSTCCPLLEDVSYVGARRPS